MKIGVISVGRYFLLAPVMALLGYGAAYAGGFAAGHLNSFHPIDSGSTSEHKVIRISFDPNRQYESLNGYTTLPAFSGFSDQSGLCQNTTSIADNYVSLIITDLTENPMKRVHYGMLMAAVLTGRPVEVSLGDCIRDNIGGVSWGIKNVLFPGHEVD